YCRRVRKRGDAANDYCGNVTEKRLRSHCGLLSRQSHEPSQDAAGSAALFAKAPIQVEATRVSRFRIIERAKEFTPRLTTAATIHLWSSAFLCSIVKIRSATARPLSRLGEGRSETAETE